MSLINPASTGIEGQMIGVNYKTSMMGIENGPKVQSLIYHSDENKNASWGISVQNEKVNIESYGIASFDYSYRIQISPNTKINFGLKGGVFFNSIDINSIERVTQENNSSLKIVNNYWNPILGMGLFLKGNNYYLGISINNLLKSNRYQEENGIVSQAIDKGQLYISSGIDIKLTDILTLRPSLIYSFVKNLDNQLTAITNLEINDKISVGLGVSNNYYTNYQILFKGFKNFELGFGYESRNSINSQNVTSALKANNTELLLRYRIIINKARKSSWDN
tara:strand:+ start:257 stop:1090 length:834 start_codon:yes stop_codon:yes gene_type:complete